MNHVFHAMGTAVSLSGDVPPTAVEEATAAFEELEERFSLYRETSEASRVARGELALGEASQNFRATHELMVGWQHRTRGAFTARRPDGTVDLNGIVKALAIQQAGHILDAHGSEHWCVNAGGDVLTRTGGGREPWVAGIVDPFDRADLLSQFDLGARLPAIATSGTAERGEHVWRTSGSAKGDPFVQVSVAAPDIITADVLATAILSGGAWTLQLATSTWPVEVVTVSRSGALRATAAFHRAA